MHKHAVCHETPHDHVYGWRFVFLLVLPESLGCFQTFIRGDCTIIVLDSSGLSLHNALTGNNAECLVCNYISFTLSSLFTVSVDCIQAVLTNCKPNISCVLPTKQIRKRTWRQMTDTCVSHSGTLLKYKTLQVQNWCDKIQILIWFLNLKRFYQTKSNCTGMMKLVLDQFWALKLCSVYWCLYVTWFDSLEIQWM